MREWLTSRCTFIMSFSLCVCIPFFSYCSTSCTAHQFFLAPSKSRTVKHLTRSDLLLGCKSFRHWRVVMIFISYAVKNAIKSVSLMEGDHGKKKIAGCQSIKVSWWKDIRHIRMSFVNINTVTAAVSGNEQWGKHDDAFIHHVLP